MEPGSAHSVQAGDGVLTVAIALVWLLLGLASAIAGCPGAAAGPDPMAG